MQAIDYLLIGHITQDQTPHGPMLGGTAAYCAGTIQAFGLRVGLVTSARANEPLLRQLETNGVQIVNRPAPHTTTFTNTYHPAGRRQILSARAAPLGPADVPPEWKDTPIVHLGPVAAEIAPDCAAHFPGAFMALTPQGWLRAWDAEGIVRRCAWPAAAEVLPLASATVLSPEDLQSDPAQIAAYIRQTRLLVITQQQRGADIHIGAEVYHVPTRTVDEVDPTGAGDIFAAVFFARLWQHPNDPVGAARLANYLATTSITRQGLASVPTSAELHAALAALGMTDT